MLRSMSIKATPGELIAPGVGKTNFEPTNLSGFEGFTRQEEQDLRTDRSRATPRTLLDSGFPSAGSDRGGLPGHRFLALGFPNSSGLGSFGSGSRHGGSDSRSPRGLVFLVLATHVTAVTENSPRSTFQLAYCRNLKTSSLYLAPALPTKMLYPGFSGQGDCSFAIGLIYRTPPPRYPFLS